MTFSSIAYEKGSAFLLALEQKLGTGERCVSYSTRVER